MDVVIRAIAYISMHSGTSFVTELSCVQKCKDSQDELSTVDEAMEGDPLEPPGLPSLRSARGHRVSAGKASHGPDAKRRR